MCFFFWQSGFPYRSIGLFLQIDGLPQVLPGERVPVDGEVVTGRGSCDEAMLTGESALVPKTPGAQVPTSEQRVFYITGQHGPQPSASSLTLIMWDRLVAACAPGPCRAPHA